ncbi:hypothetical protein D3C87_2159290 [compost metagenome]
MELTQALAQREVAVAFDAAASDEGKLAAFGDDDAPAGSPEAGIDAENANRGCHDAIKLASVSDLSRVELARG